MSSRSAQEKLARFSCKAYVSKTTRFPTDPELVGIRLKDGKQQNSSGLVLALAPYPSWYVSMGLDWASYVTIQRHHICKASKTQLLHTIGVFSSYF